mmetsp:Transcript_3166/g.3572  ORF Transcript_3166/g.3572 Transcript_3166/m.3572 type:complete len:137 (-) Transcript_3166:70-480(-)
MMGEARQRGFELATMLFEMNSLELRSGPDSPRAELKKLVRKNQQVPASISTNIDDEDLRLVTEDVIDDLPWDDTSQTIRQCTWCGKFEDKQTTAAPMKCCSACKKGGEFVWYCNRVCQSTHWTKGPHKTWCMGNKW